MVRQARARHAGPVTRSSSIACMLILCTKPLKSQPFSLHLPQPEINKPPVVLDVCPADGQATCYSRTKRRRRTEVMPDTDDCRKHVPAAPLEDCLVTTGKVVLTDAKWKSHLVRLGRAADKHATTRLRPQCCPAAVMSDMIIGTSSATTIFVTLSPLALPVFESKL